MLAVPIAQREAIELGRQVGDLPRISRRSREMKVRSETSRGLKESRARGRRNPLLEFVCLEQRLRGRRGWTEGQDQDRA